MAEELGPALVNVDVRPIRLTYAVADGSEADFRAAVLEASSRWGGLQELILPVGSDGRILEEWFPLTDVAPPDYVCATSNFAEWRNSLQEQSQRGVVDLSYVQQHATLHAAAVQPSFGHTNVFAAQPDDNLVSLVGLGAASDAEQLSAWQAVGQTVFPQPIGPLQVAGAQLNESSLIAATGRQCGETALYGVSGGPIVLWLSEPDSLEDALGFWNTRALIPVRLAHFASCILPRDWEDAGELKAMLEAVRNKQNYVYEPDMIVYSRSLDETTLRAFIATLGVKEYSADTFSLTPTTPGTARTAQQLTAAIANPSWFVARRRDFGTRATEPTYLRRNGTIITVDSPVQFRPGIGGEVRLRFSGPSAFTIPASLSAAKLFERNAVIAQGFVEVSTWPAAHYTFNLAIPERGAILDAYLTDRRVTHGLSDKGRLAGGVLGAIPEVDRIRDTVALRVIDALTTHRFKYELREMRRELPEVPEARREEFARRLMNVRQETRTLERIFEEVRGADVAAPTQIGAVLNPLADAGIVLRGFQADCPVCGMKAFIELSDATAPAICPGCRSEAPYSLDNASQPVIHYRLNALIDRASDQGVLGHVIVVAALRDLYGDDVVAIPGTNLTFPDGTAREADILALVHGDIWSGEVKPGSDDFTDTQIHRDLDLVEAVGASTYLMACVAGIELSTIDRALTFCAARDIRLAILVGPRDAIRTLSKLDLQPSGVASVTLPPADTPKSAPPSKR